MKVMQRMAYITLGMDENNCFLFKVMSDSILFLVL